MTINVHSLLHLPEAVKNLGPLWAHSCFAFESANGELLQLFHGSQAVEKQVCNRYNGILAKVALIMGLADWISLSGCLYCMVTNMADNELKNHLHVLVNFVAVLGVVDLLMTQVSANGHSREC